MNTLHSTPVLPFPLSIESDQVLVVITEGRQRRGLTELVAQLALRGPFQMIAGGQWVPDQDDLYTSLKHYTTNIENASSNLSLMRPETHLKLLNLVSESGQRNDPLLILDFLHLFYTDDIDIARRKRMVEKCCEHLRKIKLTRPVVIFMREMPLEQNYELFHPVVVSIADDIVQLERGALIEALLPEVNMGRDLLSARALAEKLKAKMNYIGTMIDPDDRRITKQFGEWIMDHSVEIHRSTQLAPMEAALSMIALEEHKRITRLVNELHSFMQETDKTLDRLTELIPVMNE